MTVELHEQKLLKIMLYYVVALCNATIVAHACNCILGTKIEMVKKEKDFIAGTFTPFADDENGMHIIR